MAQSEFTVAPLLKVPPASRGEPRARPVSPARRENLQEGGYGLRLSPPSAQNALGDQFGGNQRHRDTVAGLRACPH